MARFPNSLSFRMVATITVDDPAEVPREFTGRVAVHGAHGLDCVLWLDRGQLDDPTTDVPALTRYRPTGAVKQERHYRLGRLHDPEPGVPAVRGYFADGALKYAEHFRYGWRHDDGDRPAIRKWRTDGTLRTERHYVDDVRVDATGRRRRRDTGAIDPTGRAGQSSGVGSPMRSLVDASPGRRTKQ